ncbi:MAG: hypothetical protein BGO14_00365 [Chlamydiales bacterium 38-26]|nr:protein kinase [Chlamydiales bacterium]OJV07179.1 MAG: hypothetical protein BGO14_00365 [Chlamydiales bacterium 38-26]
MSELHTLPHPQSTVSLDTENLYHVHPENEPIKHTKSCVIHVQVIHKNTGEVKTIPLKKESFFPSLEFKLSKGLSKKKILRVDLADKNNENKPTTFYARISEISQAMGITPKEAKKLYKAQGFESMTREHNLLLLKEKVEKVFHQIEFSSLAQTFERSLDNHSLPILNEMLKIVPADTKQDEFLAFIQGIHDVQGIKSKEEIFDKLKNHLKLTDEQFEKLKLLQSVAPPEFLYLLLNIQSRRVLNTLMKAASLVENKGQEHFYIKKEAGACSFVLTKEGELIIAFDYLKAGATKKVNMAINVTHFEAWIKATVRGARNVKDTIHEMEFITKLYDAKNPYLIKPAKVIRLERTSEIDSKTQATQESVPKYIYFDKKFDGDGRDIPPKDTYAIAQFIHDYAKGLSFLHRHGYVHGDVKPANALLKGKRAIVSDLEFVSKTHGKLMGVSPLFAAPENLERMNNNYGFVGEVSPNFDRYSLGITILSMLFSDFSEICTQTGETIYGFMNHAQKKEVLKILETQIQKIEDNITEEEAYLRLKLMHLALLLTDIDEGQRPSCSEVCKEIAKAFPQITTEDPL